MRLLLVRHARSVLPVVGGPSERERPLAPEGSDQAASLVPVLAAHRPRRVVSSPYLRAVQTVEPTAQALGLPVEPVEDLREWRSGVPPRPDWESHYRWAWAHPDAVVGDGESHAQLRARAVTAITAVVRSSEEDDVVVLGSHGTWITRALDGLGVPVDVETWLGMPMPAVLVLGVQDGVLASATGPGVDWRR